MNMMDTRNLRKDNQIRSTIPIDGNKILGVRLSASGKSDTFTELVGQVLDMINVDFFKSETVNFSKVAATVKRRLFKYFEYRQSKRSRISIA